MAKLSKLPNAQWPIAAVFEWNYDDTMDNISAVELALGADDAVVTTFDVLTPPPGAIVIGGNVKNITAATGSTTSTVDVGDSDDPNRYTEGGAHDLKDADAPATAFDMLGDHKQYDGSQAIRLTILNDGAQTAGNFILTVLMVVPGKATENLKTT
jgi:hypothetical protein